MRVAIRAGALALAVSLSACDPPEADPFAEPPARALEPAEAERVYAALEGGDGALGAALDDVVARGDHRFVAVLIEALRASQIGLLDGRHYEVKVVALERLSGQPLGADWIAWVRWYQGTSLRAPPGFDAFRSRILARADPALAAYFANELPRRVRSEEILWSGALPEPGGPRTPELRGAAQAGLEDGEPVVGVVVGGEARAYPLRWLDRHEVANDRLGGRDVAVVWCGFCASAAAFAAGRDGAPARRFGSSGLVQRSVRLMADRESGTLWNELTGAPVLGPGAGPEGASLAPIPALLTHWAAWRARNPTTTVLALADAGGDPHSPGPYDRYHASDETVFPVALERDELAAKRQVYGLEAGGRAKAWPLEALLEERVLNDSLGDSPLVLVATRGRIEIEGIHPERGRVRFSPGSEVRAYARGDVSFRPGAEPDALIDQDGRAWRAGDAELVGPDGARGRRLPGSVAYWFAWQAFHADTELYPAPR
jgi:hypothetical protein